MNGLLTVKPGNEPIVGAVKLFTVEQRISANGAGWTKIKHAKAEDGGQPYRIMSAKPTGRTDLYGNISFNVELDADPTAQPIGPLSTLPPRAGVYPMSKDDYWSRKEKRDLEQIPRIQRQHSQEMALRYFAIMGGVPGATTPEEITRKLREMIDWFERDIGYTPKEETQPVVESQDGEIVYE